jgi:type II secretory pathway component PulF
MTTSDIRPRHADLLGPIVGRGLPAAALAVVLGLVWFACRFIAPRSEASLMDAGLRPSPTVRGLLIASSYVARYFWWIAPILVAFFLFSSNVSSRTAARGTAAE